MSRRRHNDTYYTMTMRSPLEGTIQLDGDNLQQLATKINHKLFSGFPILTRSMLANWVSKPRACRRDWAKHVSICKVSQRL